MWYVKNMAVRLSRAVLRCLPILIVAVLLPKPLNITLPHDPLAGLLFLVSIFLGFSVLTAFFMLLYISAFYTLSPTGIRILATSVIEFFAGAIIPLLFFPSELLPVINALPFASMQNTPFLIYNGFISGSDIIRSILLQLGCLVILVALGKMLMNRALKKVIVQGG